MPGSLQMPDRGQDRITIEQGIVLVDAFGPPPSIVGDAVVVRRFTSPAARDPIDVACFAGGGLLSYARPDGTWLHTLNTPDGLRRKLTQLGIDLPAT